MMESDLTLPFMSSADILRFFRKTDFEPGELARVRQILRPSGTSLILPYDQFIEHDNRHIDAKNGCGDPDYIMNLALEGGYNAVTVHYGVAKRYWAKLEGAVPLILKINGKTSFPSQAEALSVHTSWVEDAVRIGAVGIGYTMYYGSPAQKIDLPQLANVRMLCEKYGMPLVVWAYPRGSAVDQKGGPDGLYAVQSAVRMAMEMGATIIKANLPKAMTEEDFQNEGIPDIFKEQEREIMALPDKYSQKRARARIIVEAAQGVPILFSGGSKISDEDLLMNAQVCMEAGGFGFIFGRNMWKREKSDSLQITRRLQTLLDEKAMPIF